MNSFFARAGKSASWGFATISSAEQLEEIAQKLEELNKKPLYLAGSKAVVVSVARKQPEDDEKQETQESNKATPAPSFSTMTNAFSLQSSATSTVKPGRLLLLFAVVAKSVILMFSFPNALSSSATKKRQSKKEAEQTSAPSVADKSSAKQRDQEEAEEAEPRSSKSAKQTQEQDKIEPRKETAQKIDKGDTKRAKATKSNVTEETRPEPQSIKDTSTIEQTTKRSKKIVTEAELEAKPTKGTKETDDKEQIVDKEARQRKSKSKKDQQ